MNWYLEVLKKYAVFSGRARRKEYWFFILFNIIALIILSVIEMSTGLYTEMASNIEGEVSYLGWLSTLYSLAVLLPGIGVAIRRLHDTNRSGWWILINLIPVIGFIVYIVFMVLDSTPGTNRFGPNPKGVEAGGTAEV